MSTHNAYHTRRLSTPESLTRKHGVVPRVVNKKRYIFLSCRISQVQNGSTLYESANNARVFPITEVNSIFRVQTKTYRANFYSICSDYSGVLIQGCVFKNRRRSEHAYPSVGYENKLNET